MIYVVGAGLVGSLWALLLKQQGFAVTLLERRPDPRRRGAEAGRSINLVVTSRGLHGLERAGLAAAVRQLAVPVYGRMIHSVRGDLTYQPYGRPQDYNLSVSRGELNKFLMSAAENAGVPILFEHELTTLDLSARELTMATPQGEKKFIYKILFGTDGAGSRVRHELKKQVPDLQERTDWLPADYKELRLPADASGKPRLRQDALHIWPRGAHMMMGLANLDGSFTMTLYLPKDGPGWSFRALDSAEAIQDFFTSQFPDAVPMMPEYLKEFTEHPQGHLGTVHCSRWVFADSVALLGDAAHAIVPFFGQGMNAGFEDATTLLDLLGKNPGRWDKVLPEFEKIQRPNAAAIANMALENWVEMRDKVGDAEFLKRKQLEASLEEKFADIYRSRYGLITYTRTPYRVAELAGLLQSEILTELGRGADAGTLIEERWRPFVKEHNLKI